MLGVVGSPQNSVLSPPCRHSSSKLSHPKHLWEPSWTSPIAPGLQDPLRIPAAASVQPGPSSLPAGTCSHCCSCPPPAHLLPPPLSPEKTRNLWKNQVPNPTLPPAPRQVLILLPPVPAGTVPTAENCPPTHCSPPHPHRHHRGDGCACPGTRGSTRLHFEQQPHPPFGWGILTAFSLEQSPLPLQPLNFSIFVLSILPRPRFAHPHACGCTPRRGLP